MKEVEALVLKGPSGAQSSNPKDPIHPEPEKSDCVTEKLNGNLDSVSEKGEDSEKSKTRRCPNPLFIRRLTMLGLPVVFRPKFFFHGVPWKRMRRIWRSKEKERAVSASSTTLLRMAATRRIVTSLGRLLASKGDVIAQIRKRMRMASPEAASAGLGPGEIDGEIAIYMGDIQGEYQLCSLSSWSIYFF